MDDFKALIADAGRSLGIDGLEPDGEGVVEFFSDEAAVAVQFVPDAGDMVLWSAKVMDGRDALVASDAAALRRALEANFKSSATLSIDPEDGSLVLTDYAPLPSLSPEAFVARLESFATALLACRAELTGAASPRSSNDESSDPDSSFVIRNSSFTSPGFVAV